ncbi:MAG TPA: DUF4249 domain-containing protein [Puia sp.]|nr:DUF4249 domain-containing protein [Puia sp.]
MKHRNYHILLIRRLRHSWAALALVSAILLAACRQAYAPPAITNPNHYLVVDGFINIGANTVTTFKLTRTRNLGDSTVQGIPELGARVAIVGAGGGSWPLSEIIGTGRYASDPLTLDPTRKYSIAIVAFNGEVYNSDPVPCLVTPPIDSIFWRQPFDLNIYAGTHDPTGNTRYYRYTYNETWEHDAQLMTVWGVANGRIYAQDSTNQTQQCWTTDTSASILLASSAAESSAVIDSFPLLTVPNGDARVTKVYSILVHQYALTLDAYNYWQIIAKTSQDVGTLFDVQPTQLTGNIRCTSDPSLPAIGFITATTEQQQRILIRESSFTNWQHNQPAYGCDTTSIAPGYPDPFVYNYPDTNYAPWYFISGGPLVLASSVCLNCLLLGGTNVRPPFMP